MLNIRIPELFFKRITLILLLFISVLTVSAESYPAHCRVTTTLNVRSGPGTNYGKIGKLYKNNYIVVNSVTTNGSRQWGMIDYKGRKGYVAVQYVHYLSPVEEKPATPQQYTKNNQRFSLFSYTGDAWSVVKKILTGIFVLVCLVFWSDILEFIFRWNRSCRILDHWLNSQHWGYHRCSDSCLPEIEVDCGIFKWSLLVNLRIYLYDCLLPLLVPEPPAIDSDGTLALSYQG